MEVVQMLNLDYECMKYGQKISKISDSNLENNLRKALGVLQEDGVYAMFLWLEKNASDVNEELVEFLNGKDENEIKIKKYLLNDDKMFRKNFSKFCEDLQTVAQDIDKLLFMKKLLERTLIYALYHAKVGE